MIRIKQQAIEEGIENLNSVNFELQLMMIDEFNLVEKHEQGDTDNLTSFYVTDHG